MLKKAEVIDSDILSFFPSLDYESEKSSKYKSKKKKHFKIIELLAKKTLLDENAYITQYDLSNAKASPRIGSGVAKKALMELEKAGFLKAEKTINKKGNKKILRTLTAKGVIACMSMGQYQTIEKLRTLLGSKPSSRLAFQLKIYNEGHLRRYGAKNTNISPALSLLKEISSKGRYFNFEKMTEDAIADELQLIEENGFMESIKFSPFDLMSLTLFDEKDLEDFKTALDLIHKDKPTPETMQTITSITQNVILTITCPEAITFFKFAKNKSQNSEEMKSIFEDLLSSVSERLKASPLQFSNEFERFNQGLLIARQIMRERLMQGNRELFIKPSKSP